MRIKNATFAKKDKSFLEACEKVREVEGYEKFEPSKRQASKWRRGKGIAFKVVNKLYKKKGDKI